MRVYLGEKKEYMLLYSIEVTTTYLSSGITCGLGLGCHSTLHVYWQTHVLTVSTSEWQ